MAVPAASWGRPGGVRGRPGASRGRPGASRGVGASQRVPGRPGASLGVPGAPPDTCPRGAPGRPRDTCPGAPPGRPGTPPGRPGTPFSAVSAWRLRFRNPCRLVFSATVVHFHQDVVLGSNPFFVNFWLPQAPLRRDSIGLCRNVATAEFVRSSSSACYSRENAFASFKNNFTDGLRSGYFAKSRQPFHVMFFSVFSYPYKWSDSPPTKPSAFHYVTYCSGFGPKFFSI